MEKNTRKNIQINELVMAINKYTKVEPKNCFELQNAWSDLYVLVEPDMNKLVNSVTYKYTRTHNIDPSQFEEAMHTAFMKAVENFDPSKGEFLARMNHIAMNLFKNVVRDSQADIRKAMTGSLSLNTTLSEDEDEVVTFQDQLVDTKMNVEKAVEEREVTIFDVLNEYKNRNNRTKKEAELIEIYLTYSDENQRREALMDYMGEGAKWVNVRKAVSRANQNFRKVLQEAGKM